MFLFAREHVGMIVVNYPRMKSQTRRLHKRAHAVAGGIHWAQRGTTADTRFARLKVTRVCTENLWNISEADVLAEGYENREAYFEAFNRINKRDKAGVSAIPSPVVYCYEFEVLSVTDYGMQESVRAAKEYDAGLSE